MDISEIDMSIQPFYVVLWMIKSRLSDHTVLLLEIEYKWFFDDPL